MVLQIPTVTPDDLRNFHARHFPQAPLPPYPLGDLNSTAEEEGQNYEEYYEEDDDGLGYYEDGTKRTLTDEQIALFRHSEIQRIIQERKRRRENGDMSTPETDPKPAAFGKKQVAPTTPADENATATPQQTLASTQSASNLALVDQPSGPTAPVTEPQPPAQQQQWKKVGAKSKARNARHKKNNRENHRRRKTEKRKEQRREKEKQQNGDVSGTSSHKWKKEDQEEGEAYSNDGGEQSDEWDPWHQATGPDAQTAWSADLDY